MSEPDPTAELARCDREIKGIEAEALAGNPDVEGMLLGLHDWRTEKRLIQEDTKQVKALKAPFPWFGGKSRVAHWVWDRFGNVDNYVEPFAGSLAVLLGRPHEAGTETVNDMDCFLSNFWRALSSDPEGVAEYADAPVNEADLHARHLWLVNRLDFRERMKTDPDFYDVKIAGWWVWGISQWIGSGWCSRPEWTGQSVAVDRKRPMIHGGHYGKGIHAEQPGAMGVGINQVSRQIPHLGDAGTGKKRPHLSGRGTGIGIHGDKASSGLYAYFYGLAARLRRVRVCCGDWTRVMGPSVTVKHGVCGIFLDPPYDMRVVSGNAADGLYSEHNNDVSADVRTWAIENGENHLLRIALCGYEGEHTMPESWERIAWKAHGGYGSQSGRGRENADRERIWFSPACLKRGGLFDEL